MDMVKNLLTDLEASINRSSGHTFEVLVTHNLPENSIRNTHTINITEIHNERRKGFGENHNAAFGATECDYFVVLNPDIRLNDNFEWRNLTRLMRVDTGVLAPVVMDAVGEPQDNMRKYPSPRRIAKRFIIRWFAGEVPKDYPKVNPYERFEIDWVAGMFMVFNAGVYRKVGGFDEKYFMYVEDADICCRMASKGFGVIGVGCNSVIHIAQHGSRKQLRYFLWHFKSMMRFFILRALSHR